MSPSRDPVGITASTGPRVGLLYPSGWGNIGDEAILTAAIKLIRDQWPDASIRAFTANPEGTASRHQVEGDQLIGINRPGFGVSTTRRPRLLIRIGWRVARLASLPWVGAAIGKPLGWLTELAAELVAIARAIRWLRSADLLLAPGGGQLDDYWGGPWGHPYALARWSLLATWTRVPFALLSVGFGAAASPLSRYFLRTAVGRSNYCSVREPGSVAKLREIGCTRPVPVVPDLAFQLRPAPGGSRPRTVIGVAPISYLRPGVWPVADPELHRRFVRQWIALVGYRLERGETICLFVTSPSDEVVVDEIWAELAPAAGERLQRFRLAAVEEHLALMDSLRLVVASRLHGVVLALVAERPVVALSFERKVEAAMLDAGLERFCVGLADSDAREWDSLVDQVIADEGRIAVQVSDRVGQWRSQLESYHEVLPSLIEPSGQ